MINLVSPDTPSPHSVHDHMDDTSLLLQAVFDASLPKFIAEDVPVFLGIVEDLFPSYNSKQEEHLALRAAIKEVMRENFYLPSEPQVRQSIYCGASDCLSHEFISLHEYHL